jgi:glutathione peroxidase
MMQRRTFLMLSSAALVSPLIADDANAQGAGMTRVTAYAFSFKALKDGDIRLADHIGKPILIVNTASLCGYTPQYTGLQELWTRYRDKGLMIIAVPSNDFGGQEPGGEAEIDHTAHQYNVTFPVANKASVKAQPLHPFYRWAAIERPLETPRWNFHKYLVGRDGHIAAVFATAVEPTDPRVIAAIEKQLP